MACLPLGRKRKRAEQGLDDFPPAYLFGKGQGVRFPAPSAQEPERPGAESPPCRAFPLPGMGSPRGITSERHSRRDLFLGIEGGRFPFKSLPQVPMFITKCSNPRELPGLLTSSRSF